MIARGLCPLCFELIDADGYCSEHRKGRFIVVTGDRDWTDATDVRWALHDTRTNHVIAGGARGLDTIAVEEAAFLGIGWEVIRADWERYGKAAGPIRNGEMLDRLLQYRQLLGVDAGVFAWHNDLTKSRGTRNCVKQAIERDLRVVLFTNVTRGPRSFLLTRDAFEASDFLRNPLENDDWPWDRLGELSGGSGEPRS